MLVLNNKINRLQPLEPVSNIDHIYIVTVNYKSSSSLGELISSISSLRYDLSNITILIVDSSNDFEYIASPPCKTEIIKLPQNLGFAFAANVGMRTAATKSKNKNNYIWLLNPDTILEPQSLEKALENINTTTIHGSVVTENGFRQNSLIWGAGGFIDKALTVEMKYTGDILENIPKAPYPCDYVPGCSMLLHHSIPENYGYMPEEYFLYFEETDWCLSLKRKGINLLINPQSLIQHQSSTNKMQAPFRVYFYNRNETYFKVKNEKHSAYKIKKLLFLMIEISKLLSLNMRNKDEGLAQTFKAHLFAKVDVLQMLLLKNKSNVHQLSQNRLRKFMS